MKLLLIKLLVLILLTGCNAGVPSVDNKILEKIKSCSKIENCQISVSDLVDFKWDKVYFFKYTSSKSDIENIIGLDLKLEDYTEFTEKLIFLNNNQLVNVENLQTHISKLTEDDMVFKIGDKKQYESYTPEEAIFNVYKHEINSPGEYYYILESINHTNSN